MTKKIRLDQLLVQRGLADTRTKAQALIMAGAVRAAGTTQHKSGDMLLPDVDIELIATLPYVSRGGYKLAHALDVFGLSPAGLIALDTGASTGGFTDVLLQRGAKHVYAIDVGYGILDWKLRNDSRITVMERTNVRYLETLGEPPIHVDCATLDVSFISLKLVLPAIQRLIQPSAWIVALIKPQFEAGSEIVDKGAGVIRDPQVHRHVIEDILTFAEDCGLPPHAITRSPITGPAGNVEFLVWLGSKGLVFDQAQIDTVLHK